MGTRIAGSRRTRTIATVPEPAAHRARTRMYPHVPAHISSSPLRTYPLRHTHHYQQHTTHTPIHVYLSVCARTEGRLCFMLRLSFFQHAHALSVPLSVSLLPVLSFAQHARALCPPVRLLAACPCVWCVLLCWILCRQHGRRHCPWRGHILALLTVLTVCRLCAVDRVGVIALGVGTFYFAKTDLDKKRLEAIKKEG